MGGEGRVAPLALSEKPLSPLEGDGGLSPKPQQDLTGLITNYVQ